MLETRPVHRMTASSLRRSEALVASKCLIRQALIAQDDRENPHCANSGSRR
jgi:hypothetical protein